MMNMHGWRESLAVYLKARVFVMLFLGFSAGLPLLLIFSTLSIWLRKAGIDRGTVTYFSWAALAYSFKFVWSPLIDRLPIPVLHHALGRRRSWLIVSQVSMVLAIFLIAMTDPATGLQFMAIAVVLLGFSSATQDIVIDALRIESASEEFQAAMSAMYVAGYRIAMLASGAGSLYLASLFGQGEEGYVFLAWQKTYLCMAGLVFIGVITTLMISEPEASQNFDSPIHTRSDYVQFLGMFVLITTVFVLSFVFLDVSLQVKNFLQSLTGEVVASFIGQVIRFTIALGVATSVAFVVVNLGWVNRNMLVMTYISPVLDFFQRYKKQAVFILLFIGLYRISDIVLGVITNVFYDDMGFSLEEIASYTKVFGVIMIIVGGFIGGIVTTRFGVMPVLLSGAILVAMTNLLFMVLAVKGDDTFWLGIVIAADNLSAGIATAAFIAYLSSLTNISFTAIQYAIFSSLMTLLPKTIGGYSGSMVNQLGYSNFFLLASLMGVPAILMVLYLMRQDNRNKAASEP